MAFSPGRNAGRVSIRVVPDTTRFRPDLKRRLDTIEKTTSMSVRVDKANVDRSKFRASIQRQLAELRDVDVNTKVAVTVDSAKIRRGALRRSIQEQFDQMKDVRVWIAPGIHEKDEQKFHRQVERMVDRAKSTVSIGVNAHTAAAAAQLRYTTRPRFVDIFVRVNEASVLVAARTLAALSGARLTYNWLDDLAEMAKNLDKSLPRIIGWTSSITGLFAAVAGTLSGVIGVGQGLFSITPALLVLPGLLLNAVGSLTVLIVALRHAKDELGVLGDDMNELGGIMRETFWENARDPIIQLVQGLMPQLRTSFRELASGVGEFTGALAGAFGRELDGGRLESIFSGIAEGWRILGTGADGFAGAIVSLSQIAARYTPRLAAWFVRQANTFDAWLEAIANDGRLSAWMEQAIDSMYDLWDATTGAAGVLEGIWRAADAAGSGGLKGFAEMMQDWKRITNGADFQRGLTAIFRGSYAAMDAFGGAVSSIGRLFSSMPQQFERFIGSVGGFIGGIIDEAFQALNNERVAVGLDGLSGGLEEALREIAPSLQPIAETFGGFIDLLGTLASSILPTAVGAVAALTPSIDTLMGVVDDVVPDLAAATDTFVTELAPPINDLIAALGPPIQSAFKTLSDALKGIAPDIADLVEALSPALVAAMTALAAALKPLADLSSTLFDIIGVGGKALGDLSWLWDDKALNRTVDDIISNGGWTAELFKWAEDFDRQFAEQGQQSAQSFLDSITGGIEGGVEGMVSRWTAVIVTEFNTKGPAAGNSMWQSLLGSDLPPEVKERVYANLSALDVGIQERGRSGGGGFSRGLAQGISESMSGAVEAGRVGGSNAMSSFGTGADGQKIRAVGVFGGLAASIRGVFAGAGSWLWNAGSAILNGLLSGMRSAYEGVKSFVSGIASWIVANKGPISYDRRLLIPAGRSIMKGLDTGIRIGFEDVRSNVRGIAGAISNEFGARAGAGGAGTTINVTQPLLPGETPQEQRDNLVKELQWVF